MILYTRKHHIPFQIDRADYPSVSRYSWHINEGYPTTTLPIQSRGNRHKELRLHNFLMGYAPDDLEWDHKDRDRLNNRRGNLRLVTHQQNQCNKPIPDNNTSGVKGVFRAGNRWKAQLSHKHIGSYKTLDEAAKARKAAEDKLWV